MSDGKESAIDADAIRELAELLTETQLTEIEIEKKGVRLRVARQAVMPHSHAVAAPQSTPAAEATKRETANGAVPSPMVGTVYVAPEPGAAPFVKVGDAVKEGDTLMIVEAMKTMNPILAPRAGIVSEICVHDAEPVEFGQPLIVLN
jgi:acetyl-CoA carboxylase biotin carboxyl carrier protein